jgi:hypothetical protein
MLIRCNDSAHLERARLFEMAKELRSIVETASYDQNTCVWRRGATILSLSGPTFELKGSKHAVSRAGSCFMITLPGRPPVGEGAWNKAMRLADALVAALSDLDAQSHETSCGSLPASVEIARSTLIAAASLKGLASYEIVLRAACPGQDASATVCTDSMMEWTLRPDVEKTLVSPMPETIMIDHTRGVDMTIVGPWQHDEEPEDDAMDVLRRIASSDVSEKDLELRSAWA